MSAPSRPGRGASVWRRAVAAVLLAFAPTAWAEAPDPLEPVNRVVWRFNEGLDRWTLKPLGQAYERVAPAALRTGLANAFRNLGEPVNAVLHLAQGSPSRSVRSLLRFGVNSSFGLLGLLDLAALSGVDAYDTDLGQTLGVWGVGAGPYLVLPLLGPSNARDGVASLVELATEPLGLLSDVPARNALVSTRTVSDRALLLPAEAFLDDTLLDRYAFVRDAYSARRARLIEQLLEADSTTRASPTPPTPSVP